MSIARPDPSIEGNVVGTFALLEETPRYWTELSDPAIDVLRPLYVSTEEVYGALEPVDAATREPDADRPNSPYSASKAAADCHPLQQQLLTMPVFEKALGLMAACSEEIALGRR